MPIDTLYKIMLVGLLYLPMSHCESYNDIAGDLGIWES